MILQKILFPEIGKCTEKELYYHRYRKMYQNTESLIDYDFDRQCLTLQKGGKVYFDTYFNGFSIEKWRKYTVIEEVNLLLQFSGKMKISLLNKELVHQEVTEATLAEKIVDHGTEIEKCELTFGKNAGKGMYTFGIEALDDNCEFYGGAYCSNVLNKQIRKVKIGIGICTFKREEFIEKNLEILNHSILQNELSPLYGKLEVFISDNAKSLDRVHLQTEQIHIFPNKNVGGAGGFTRNLIEMYAYNNEHHITHALLMDDDITIEPESIVKTYILLTLLKDEYVDTFIGGAMLRRDKQYMQVESGAAWNGGNLFSLKCNLDMKICESCLQNEWEEYAEFNAWWYCCFPISLVKDDNLPLPIFIRGDDLEYGLRNMKNLILMNGICVWHEPFENKYSSFLEYYIMRNQLIDNSFHCPWYTAKHARKTILKHCIQEIMFYRYKNVELYHQGIKDFLKGPLWLLEQDGEILHKRVMEAGYKGTDIDTLDIPFYIGEYDHNRFCSDSKWRRRFRYITMNGLLFPAKGVTCVPMAQARSVQFYRKSRVMHYDIMSRKGFVTEKSISQSFKYLFKTIGLLIRLDFQMSNAQEAYRRDGMRLRTREFWNGYLGLNG